MKTDSLFYELFQKFPDTLFALTGQSADLTAQFQKRSSKLRRHLHADPAGVTDLF